MKGFIHETFLSDQLMDDFSYLYAYCLNRECLYCWKFKHTTFFKWNTYYTSKAGNIFFNVTYTFGFKFPPLAEECSNSIIANMIRQKNVLAFSIMQNHVLIEDVLWTKSYIQLLQQLSRMRRDHPWASITYIYPYGMG